MPIYKQHLVYTEVNNDQAFNKTSMIQILRAAVPAIVPTGFVKS